MFLVFFHDTKTLVFTPNSRGKPESFDDFTTTCFAKEEPPEAERDEEAQEEHNEAP